MTSDEVDGSWGWAVSMAMAQVRESRDAVRDVFRNPWLRRINLALLGSTIGDWAFGIGVSVYAYERGGPSAVGAVMAIRYISAAVLGPFVAVLADRMDRRVLMITSDLVRAVLTVCAAVLVWMDGPAGGVYSLFFIVVWTGLAFRPAQSAWMPSLASSPGELTAANATALTFHSVAFFAGPAIAGGLLALTGVQWVFVFDAVTFLWSASLIFGIRADAKPEPAADTPAEGEAPAADGGVSEGFRTILRNRHLRLVVVLYIAQTIVAGASAVYEVAIALDLLDLGKGGLGLLGMGLGIGGVTGGAVALLLSQRGRLARDFGLGVVLWGAPLLLVAAWPNVATALIAMATIGLGNSVVDVNAETIVQRLSPSDVMGRVFGALDACAIGGMALGSFLMPLLIKGIGLRWGLTVIGTLVPLVVLVGVAGLRRIDREALAPEGLDLIRAVPMFAVLPDHLVERLARTATVFRIPAGASVFHEGDAGDRFYVIEDGEVDVSIQGRSVNHMRAGEGFGEIALLRDVPRTATITARTDLVLRAIDRRHFIHAVTGHAAASEQAELTVARFGMMA